MKPTIQTLAQQLNSGAIRSMDHLLELLYEAYINTTPTDQKRINQLLQELDTRVAPLPFPEQDEILCGVNALCAEHERIAFLDGVRAGTRLTLELLEIL